jgi:2-hydroxychromene-2-carboxylate isomerase
MAQPLTFYTEFSSPYAYLAAQTIDEMAARHGRDVLWRPVSLGHVFQAIGYTADMVPKVKREHSRVDVARCARLSDVPFVRPESFPADAKLARLVFYRLDRRDPDLARRFAFGVFYKFWGEGHDICEPETLVGLGAGLRINAEEIEAAADDAEAKAAMIQHTNAAIESGCFGMPWIVVDGETFWGHDRLDYIDRYLATAS